MKRELLIVLILLVAGKAFTAEVEIGGLWYEVLSKTKEAKVIQYKNNKKYSGNIVIPEIVEYDGANYDVKSIGAYAFYECSISAVTIPPSVTSIGREAFRRSRITSVIIPNGVTCLEYGVFSDTPITTVTIPNNVTTIEQGAFAGSQLTSVVIPNSVTNIGIYAFNACGRLTSVHISDLEAWCKIVFNGDMSNPLDCAHHLFLNGEEVKNLVIPSSVTSIGDGAFRNCIGLTSVTMPNSVESIGWAAFYNCNGLTSIKIGNNVKNIGGNAFYGCVGLTSITIPMNVTSIGSGAFSGCVGLTSVMIPNSVTSIGGNAFYDCKNLTTITIGSGISSISQKAFALCPDLSKVYCYAENVPYTNSDVFEGSYIEHSTLYVPTASIEAYNSTIPWSVFKTIMGTDGTTLETKKCSTPTISIEDGKIKFNCETEGVDFVSNISTTDTNNYYDAVLTLTYKYKVTVYATKDGYENSDTVTAEFTANGKFGDLNGDGIINVADHVKLSDIIMNQ